MGLCSLVQRNRFGIYEIRKRVLEDLQQILGKKSIKRSLGTANGSVFCHIPLATSRIAHMMDVSVM